MALHLPEFILNQNDFEEIGPLGKGRFTEVFLVKRKSPPGERLVRRQWYNSPRQDYCLAEVETLCKISYHPAICRGVGWLPSPLSVYCEYLENSTLASVFNSPGPQWNGTLKAKTVFGIAAAMMHLHANGIVHRSLNPENVMFDSKWDVRVVDFTHARHVNEGQCSSLPGQACYHPPECLSDEIADGTREFTVHEMEKVDIWAFGMILAQIITGKQPYSDLSGPLLVGRAILTGKLPQLPDDGSLITGICAGCWAKDPDDRPEFYHVVHALKNSEEPLFPDADVDKVEEYMKIVLDKTKMTENAKQVFNSPPTEDPVIRQPPPTSFDEWKRAADEGNARAQLRVGRAYAHGKGVAKDLGLAYEYQKKAADQKNITAMLNVGLYLKNGYGCPKNEKLGADYLRQSADAGMIRAQAEYALVLETGKGVKKNPELALEYYRRAANHGHVASMYQYARMCYLGDGCAKDPVEALKYYQYGHQAGDPNASCDYALMLVKGAPGVPKNQAQGIKIYEGLGMTGEYPLAWMNLGSLYDSEKDLNNKALAYTCFEKAAQQGFPAGKVQLAIYFREGTGGAPIDPVRARELLKEVADIELPRGKRDNYVLKAQTLLGIMLQTGEGGPVDVVAAFDYFGRAAALGQPQAIVKYAELVVTGPPSLSRDVELTRRYLRSMIDTYRSRPQLREDVARAQELLTQLS